MAASRNLAVSLVLIFIVLVTASQAFGMFSCCVRYTPKKLSLKAIENFYTQDSRGVCNIDAVIFTVRRPCKSKNKAPIQVCADPTQIWVQRIMAHFENPTKLRKLKNQHKKCKRQRKTYG
ncbi:C-C motif chemokine 20-like [Pseudophryne corroboree]|uniref:C-C motif chemokine 20-like n=1 Tax=Pseudophryne corroboree TaxID=495146 RepID=UPI003081DACB